MVSKAPMNDQGPLWPVAALALALGLAAAALPAAADDLRRRVSIGAAIARVPEHVRAREKMHPDEGVLVRSVLPGSPALEAGLQDGDVLVTADGEPIRGLEPFLRSLAARSPGQTLRLGLSRDGKRREAKLELRERPRETGSDAYEVLYGSVRSRDSRLRTIITRPKDGARHPALFLIPGLGCFSVDNPTGGLGVYRRVIEEFAGSGYVTLRVDKPGCGDSEGGPCSEDDFDTQLEGYRKALKMLKGLSCVDPERVFIFGHSMGGIMGPILASETPVRGIAVYGTTARPWFEYTLENTRRQTALRGETAEELDRTMRREARFQHHFYVEKKSPTQIVEAHPDLRDYVREFSPDGVHMYDVHYRFFQQLNDRNLPSHWNKIGGAHVLSIWGRADFVTSETDHAEIARMVNAARPGKATFRVMEGVDHGFQRAATQEESFNRTGPGDLNPEVFRLLREWVDARSIAAPR